MDDEALRRLWGASVRQRRLDQGMTQHELALAAGIQQSSLSKVERGEIDPGTKLRIALARALSCEVSDLFAYPLLFGSRAAS